MAGLLECHQHNGGVAALGMSMYGDLLDNDVLQEKCGKMRLYEEGFSHGNCF
jgi:hypothetical protein